jgi:F-type H+-transporting ATPase subunit gamma
MTSCARIPSLIIDRVDFAKSRRWLAPGRNGRGARSWSLFDEGEFDVCTLFYSEFKSVISQVPTAQQLIPANFEAEDGERAANGGDLRLRAGARRSRGSAAAQRSRCRSSGRCLKTLLREMGAKMSAMDNATRNAGEMIDKLTMSYNRQRQAQITKELIEIISGAEAL